MKQLPEHARLTIELIATTLYRDLYLDTPDDDCFVLLTRELAEHIVQMYNATDWDRLEDESIFLPERIFTGEVDEEEWYGYVGRHVIISLYGDPWHDISSAPAFVPGAKIELPEDLMETAATDIHHFRNNETEMDSICTLDLAIRGLMKDGLSESIIRKLFRAGLL